MDGNGEARASAASKPAWLWCGISLFMRIMQGDPRVTAGTWGGATHGGGGLAERASGGNWRSEKN
jgi:hypothetical protein